MYLNEAYQLILGAIERMPPNTSSPALAFAQQLIKHILLVEPSQSSNPWILSNSIAGSLRSAKTKKR
jgi:hypothetical protein